MAFACLMYHSLSDGRFPDRQYPRYTTTGAAFGDHLRRLCEAGFHVAGVDDLLGRVQSGTALPPKYVVLTFDDGHRSSLEMADLMLQAGVRGTFFLTRNYCRDRADFLEPDDIRHLAAAGFDFGTHGASHRALSRMPQREMRQELTDGKRWLEDVLGSPIRSMSLPAGQGNHAVLETAFECGYQLVGNSIERLNRDVTLPAVINRLVVLQGYSGALVRRIAAGSLVYMSGRRLRTAALALPKRVTRAYDRTRG